MDYEETITELKRQRKENHVTQKELASYLGVGKTYISKIENGSERASNELMEAMQEYFKRYEPENPMEILFDYVRIRFPTIEIKEVVEKILSIDVKYFLHEDYAFYGYAEQYILGDITVMMSPDIKKGILLELKGKGCRQMEIYLEAQGRTWFDFLSQAQSEGGVMKRIDLALNDKIGILDIPMLTEKAEKRECTSFFRSFKNYKSGELAGTRDQHKAEMGNTLYLGSLKSEIYFCVYEKDYEQYIRAGIPVDEAEIKNRFEIRLKNERAEKAVEDLLLTQDAGKTAFGIINRYICFLDREKGKKKSEWEMNEKWSTFLKMKDRKLKLTTKPEPYTPEKTLQWLEKQVVKSLKVFVTVDEKQGTNVIGNMMERAKLDEKHEKLISQLLTETEEMII